METHGFVNEIEMPANGAPISVREKPKPMKITVEHFPDDATGLTALQVKRYNLDKPNQPVKDIVSLGSMAANVFTLSSIWLSSNDNPNPGLYRILCLVGTTGDPEEFNLIVKVVA